MTPLANLELPSRTRSGQKALLPITANVIGVELADGCIRELTQVRINRSFLFGQLEDGRSWGLIRLSQVSALEFQTQNLEPPCNVVWTRKSAGELLSLLPLPAQTTFHFLNGPDKRKTLVAVGASRGMIATTCNHMPFVPIQAISYLEVYPNIEDRKELIL